MLDQPGSGEALRLQGLIARRESETWASWVVDWLAARNDVDTARMGVVGWSLGGYYSPRVAAFEKRFALCVAWGANHNWGAVQRRRLDREGEHPVPHYWDHVKWVWGYDDLDEFIEFADSIHLDGVVEKITVPFLIVHGENDRQIPLEYAHRSYEQAVNAPSRDLRIFTRAGGGAEHIGIDDLPQSVPTSLIGSPTPSRPWSRNRPVSTLASRSHCLPINPVRIPHARHQRRCRTATSTRTARSTAPSPKPLSPKPHRAARTGDGGATTTRWAP